MSKTRKTLIALFGVMLMVCVGLFTLTACGGSKQTLDSIRISKQPTKRAYVVGEEFNPAGMEVTATYTKGDKKESKVLETKDYTVTVDAAYLDNAGKLKLASDKTSASVKVTVSYTENKVEKTATANVSLTKPVKTVTIATQPEKTTYFAGEVFDSTGLTIDVEYTDGSKDLGIAIITSGDEKNCDIDIEGAIPSGTEKVVLTYGGKDFEIEIELARGVWIEGETGLLNGAYPNQNPTSNGGNLGLDAALTNAQAGARSFYEAQLKADFALEQLKLDPDFDETALKGVPSDRIKVNGKAIEVNAGGQVVDKLYDAICDWIASATVAETAQNYNADRAAALAAYVESNAYQALVEAYLESEEYEAEVVRLRANNDVYLGGVGQQDTVSFVFSSTGAGIGSVAFKLASAYLCKDNGNWGPVVMGDIQLNKLAEVYVNGVKCNVPDSVVLLGGKSPDGTNNQALWVNWQEVQIDNIAFVEGRNAIELRVLKHGITAPAQTSYSWSCNVDSMVILPDVEGEEEADYDLETFDNKNFSYETVINEIKIVDNEGSANLVITGRVGLDEVKGYTDDLLTGDPVTVKIGNMNNANLSIWAKTEIVMDGYNFTGTADLARLALTEEDNGHAFSITVKGAEEDYDLSEFTLPEMKVGHYTYSFNADNEIVIISDASVTFTSIALEEGTGDNAGKVYVIIGGINEGYTVEEFEALVFDMEGSNDRVVVGIETISHSTEPAEPEEGAESQEPAVINVFELKIDISDTAKFPGTTGGQFYYMHLGMSSIPGDLPAATTEIVDGKNTLTVGPNTYTLGAQYGVRGVSIKDVREVTATPEAPDIRVENGKAVYVISGTYTANEAAGNDTDFVKAAIGRYTIDFQNNQNAGAPNWTTVQITDRLVEVVIDAEAKTYEAKYDVTDMANSAYSGHYFYNGNPNSNGDWKPGTAMSKTVYLGGKSYYIEVVPGDGGGQHFWGCVGLKIADSDEPDTPETSVTPEE